MCLAASLPPSSCGLAETKAQDQSFILDMAPLAPKNCIDGYTVRKVRKLTLAVPVIKRAVSEIRLKEEGPEQGRRLRELRTEETGVSEKTDQTYRNPEEDAVDIPRPGAQRQRRDSLEQRGGGDSRRYSSHRSAWRCKDTGRGETRLGALRKAGQWHKRKRRWKRREKVENRLDVRVGRRKGIGSGYGTWPKFEQIIPSTRLGGPGGS